MQGGGGGLWQAGGWVVEGCYTGCLQETAKVVCGASGVGRGAGLTDVE